MNRALARAAMLALGLGGCSSTTTAPTPPLQPSASEVVANTAATAPSAPPSAAPSAVASAAPSGPPPVPEPQRVDVPADVEMMLISYDRTPEDRALDSGRQPGQILTFFGVAPGMHVAELAAGTGYYTELLSRSVGQNGKVYAENTKTVLEKGEKAWGERLKKGLMKNVVRVDRELDSPLPPDTKDLDAVFLFNSYHDLYWMGVDRAAMNRAVFAALKQGGAYGIVDHAAKYGEGSTVVKTLHRIEEAELEKDVLAAGFVLDQQGTFLRNPRDSKDWSTVPTPGQTNRGSSDRLVLLFRKP